MSGQRCAERHPELGYPCTLKGNHKLCSGFDADDLDGAFVDWPNPRWVPPATVDPQGVQNRLKDMAAQIRPETPAPAREGFSAGLEGSEWAAGAWTAAQVALVDAAILAVATRHAGGGEFTSDEIWDELAGSVPVTKGLTARLTRARKRLIDTTGKFAVSERGGHHDHGQRLSVWYSLIS